MAKVIIKFTEEKLNYLINTVVVIGKKLEWILYFIISKKINSGWIKGIIVKIKSCKKM